MRRALVVLAVLAAGCAGRAEDPFAYMHKPLYTGGFELDRMPAEGEQQAFRVEDGSLVRLRLQVWVNATAGGARVEVLDPQGRVALDTTATAQRSVPMELGVWTVRVTPAEGAAGHVGVRVTRG